MRRPNARDAPAHATMRFPTSRSGHRSFQLVALLANDLANDGFGFRIPIPRATVIADTDEQLDVAENVTLVCPLLEGDFLGSFDEAARFAKIARAAIFRLFHILDLRLFIRSIVAPFCAPRV